MERREFEQASRDQNARREAEVAAARANGAECVIVDMLAFGGVSYCTTHRVMGQCPYMGKTLRHAGSGR